MSKSKRKFNNEDVRIRTVDGKWVKVIVCGYVDTPYANLTTDESKAGTYKRWEADRFRNKWIPADARASFEVVDDDGNVNAVYAPASSPLVRAGNRLCDAADKINNDDGRIPASQWGELLAAMQEWRMLEDAHSAGLP